MVHGYHVMTRILIFIVELFSAFVIPCWGENFVYVGTVWPSNPDDYCVFYTNICVFGRLDNEIEERIREETYQLPVYDSWEFIPGGAPLFDILVVDGKTDELLAWHCVNEDYFSVVFYEHGRVSWRAIFPDTRWCVEIGEKTLELLKQPNDGLFTCHLPPNFIVASEEMAERIRNWLMEKIEKITKTNIRPVNFWRNGPPPWDRPLDDDKGEKR